MSGAVNPRRRRFPERNRKRRHFLQSVLIFAATYIALFFALGLCSYLVDMDGHDSQEEPIRSFVYQSIRSLYASGFLQYIAPFHRWFGTPLGGFMVWFVFLAYAVCFGVVATAIVRGWSAVASRIMRVSSDRAI